MDNNLLLCFVGNMCAGKDTCNEVIQNYIIEKNIQDATYGNNEIHVEKQKLFYCCKAGGITLNKTEGDAFIYFKEFKTSDDCTIHLFNVPLANEVKREYVEDMARQGEKINFGDLLSDHEYKSKHRQGLIDKGDGRRNTVDKFYWLVKANELISVITEKFKNNGKKHFNIFSITDARYGNELPYQEEYYEGIMPTLSFKVDAKMSTILNRMTPKQAMKYLKNHKNNASEREVKSVHADFVVNNDTTKRALWEQLAQDAFPVLQFILDDFKSNLS